MEELKQKYTPDEIDKYCFGFLRDMNLLEDVSITDKQVNEARKIAREREVPKGDTLHAVLARDNNGVVITRDQHFDLLQDIVKSLMPEEVA